MKNATRFFLPLLIFCAAHPLVAQNWPTLGGNNQHNGLSRMPGPTDAAIAWTVSSTRPTAWGNSVYSYGDRFVNTRIQLNPAYAGQLECRRLSDGALLWEKSFPGSILYAVGFDEYAVYVHDYATDEFYALDPADGSVRWKHPETFLMFGGNAGILYACNGDPVVFGKRMDRYTGETVWATDYLIPLIPDGGFAAYGDTYYHWEGTISTPKRLIAIDMNSGQIKYKSAPLPGDPDQEGPLTVGPDGTIYIYRDGGQLLGYEDTGAGFDLRWASDLTPQGRLAAGPDSSLYYFHADRLYHVDPAGGQVLDSTAQTFSFTSLPLIAVDVAGRVYFSNGALGAAGKYYCYTADLQQLLWSLPVPTNYYAGPAFGSDGTMVVIGVGTTLRALRYQGGHAPVADFQADTLSTTVGTPLDFHDLTQFGASAWQWFFPGATPASSTAQNPAGIVYDAPGQYDVALIVSNDLGQDTLLRTCYLKVVESTPVDEITEAAAVRVFPNPADEWLRVEAPSGSLVRAWRLADGRKMWQSVSPEKIDLSNWAPGLYEFVVEAGNTVWREKIAVMR